MTALSALYPDVLPFARGCPGIVALSYIREAAIEFFERTHAWNEELPDVLANVGTLTFTGALVAAQAGTLTAAWSGETRSDYVVRFDNGQTRKTTLTNGSAAVSWVGPITAGSIASYWQVFYTIPPTAGARVVKLMHFDVDGYRQRVVVPKRGQDLVAGTYFGELSGHPDCAWTTDRVNARVYPMPDSPTRRFRFTVSLKPNSAATEIPDDLFENYSRHIADGAIGKLLELPDKDWTNQKLSARKTDEFEDRISAIAAQVSRGFSSGKHRVRGRYF